MCMWKRVIACQWLVLGIFDFPNPFSCLIWCCMIQFLMLPDLAKDLLIQWYDSEIGWVIADDIFISAGSLVFTRFRLWWACLSPDRNLPSCWVLLGWHDQSLQGFWLVQLIYHMHHGRIPGNFYGFWGGQNVKRIEQNVKCWHIV